MSARKHGHKASSMPKGGVAFDQETGQMYTEAQVRFEEAEKAREQRHKADELKKELAWAHVATKEAVSAQSLLYGYLTHTYGRNSLAS